jgi:hypothetical protein
MPHQEDTIPQVFLSHASEDKDRFVRDFAYKCHKNGIECWFDEWEIKAGESLVKRISEGIEQSNVFVIVLSQTSISKPWVMKEIETAIIDHIKVDKKIIPILLDNCAVPKLLNSLSYIAIKDLYSYESEFTNFKNSVLNISIKPPVSPVLSALLQPIIFTDLTPIDNFVLKTACELVLEKNNTFVQATDLVSRLSPTLSIAEIAQSLDFLEEQYYIELLKVYGPTIIPFDVRNHAFLQFLKESYPEFDSITRQIFIMIAAEGGDHNTTTISEKFCLPRIIVYSILLYLENSDDISCLPMEGTHRQITRISTSFKLKMQNI